MPSPASGPSAAPTPPPSDLGWRIVGLVNLYRVIVASGLLVVSRIPELYGTFSVRHTRELTWICAAWLAFGLALIFVKRQRWPNAWLLAGAHVLADSLAVAGLLWATGGASSGL